MQPRLNENQPCRVQQQLEIRLWAVPVGARTPSRFGILWVAGAAHRPQVRRTRVTWLAGASAEDFTVIFWGHPHQHGTIYTSCRITLFSRRSMAIAVHCVVKAESCEQVTGDHVGSGIPAGDTLHDNQSFIKSLKNMRMDLISWTSGQ